MRQHALADLEVLGRHGGEQLRLDLGTDLGDTHCKFAACAREVDAAGAPVALVLSPLDQATPLEAVEQAHQRGALDAKRRRQLLLAHTAA